MKELKILKHGVFQEKFDNEESFLADLEVFPEFYENKSIMLCFENGETVESQPFSHDDIFEIEKLDKRRIQEPGYVFDMVFRDEDGEMLQKYETLYWKN